MGKGSRMRDGSLRTGEDRPSFNCAEVRILVIPPFNPVHARASPGNSRSRYYFTRVGRNSKRRTGVWAPELGGEVETADML